MYDFWRSIRQKITQQPNRRFVASVILPTKWPKTYASLSLSRTNTPLKTSIKIRILTSYTQNYTLCSLFVHERARSSDGTSLNIVPIYTRISIRLFLDYAKEVLEIFCSKGIRKWVTRRIDDYGLLKLLWQTQTDEISAIQ